MARKKTVVDPERGQRIRTLIEQSPYKLGEVCERLDISRTALDAILKGHSFTVDTIISISDLLNVDLDYLIRGTKSKLFAGTANDNLMMALQEVSRDAVSIKETSKDLVRKLEALMKNV
jgi:transcriptional regulator with XRE-family HTH domain